MTATVASAPSTGPPGPITASAADPAPPRASRIDFGGKDQGGAVGDAVTEVHDFSRATLLQVLARASSPAERIAGGWLRPSDEPSLAELRLSRWTRRIADGRPDRVAEILDEHGLTPDQWRTGLGDVAVRPGAPLPRWAADALTLLGRVGSEPGPHLVPSLRQVAGDGLPDWVDGDQPWRFHPGFRDWLAVAARAVDSWTESAPISESAREEIVLDLARRQLGVAGPLLMQAAAGRPVDDPLFASDARGDWESLWTSHPVVARLLATTWRQWWETTAELCGRVAADLPDIRPGALVTRIELSAGDQHCDGRGVARLRLSDGTSLYLKPRSDRLHRLLGAVLARVDGAGPPLGIDPACSLPRIVERDGYAWVLEVPDGDCADDAAVGAYFRRAGALLRVLQALGATDLHHENFVPTKDLPVLVDLETTVSPGLLRTAPLEDAMDERLSDTPGPTSMVTSAISGTPGRTSADIGALAGPVEADTPYPVRVLVQTEFGPELRSLRTPMMNGAALPRRGGHPVSLRGHEQALIDGFTEAQRRMKSLVTTGSTAADLPHPLDILAGEPAPAVRFVARPTRTYARLLQQSTAPAALVDGAERELVLELLYRATGTAPSGMIACEAEAMRDLDVPLFTIPFASTDLISDRGVVLAGALTQGPGSRTRDRLRAVAARDDHVDDLRATLFAMDPEHRAEADVPTSRVRGRAVDNRSDTVSWTEPVALLLDRAIDTGGDTLGWIGLEHDPNRNRWSYGRLSAGLTGQAGVGLALAMVAAGTSTSATELPTGCAAAARAALLGSVQRSGASGTGPADAFGGPAGVLYAAAVAGRLLHDSGLLAAARSLLIPCLVAARRDQPSFVIDGAAGAILALLQLPPDAAVADALTELADLLEPSGRGFAEVDAPDCWSVSLPSRAFGIELARNRLARLRPSGAHGRDGRDVLPVATRPGDEIAAAAMYPPAAPTAPVPGGASLRELLDQAVLARAALRSGGGPSWSARRDDVLAAITRSRARTGRWAAPLIAPDATLLSPVHGMAALAALYTDRHPDTGPDLPIARALT